MTRFVAFLIAVGFTPLSLADDVKTDVERFTGRWKIVKAEVGGAAVKNLEGGTFEFAGDNFRQRFPNGWSTKATFTLDEAVKPKRFTFVILDEAGERVVNTYIYRLEGDKLTVCGNFQDRPGLPPKTPKEFATKAGTETFLLELDRDADK